MFVEEDKLHKIKLEKQKEKSDWVKEQDKLIKLKLKEKKAKRKLNSVMMEKVIISCLPLMTIKQKENLRYLLNQQIKISKIMKRKHKQDGKSKN